MMRGKAKRTGDHSWWIRGSDRRWDGRCWWAHWVLRDSGETLLSVWIKGSHFRDLSRGIAWSNLSLTTTAWVTALTQVQATSEGWKTTHLATWSSLWPLGAKTGQITSMPILHIGKVWPRGVTGSSEGTQLECGGLGLKTCSLSWLGLGWVAIIPLSACLSCPWELPQCRQKTTHVLLGFSKLVFYLLKIHIKNSVVP